MFATDEWVKVVDVSEHNGDIDFRKMKDAGVEGVIIRATHGFSVDKKLFINTLNATLVFGKDVCFYTFCNPKRGGPQGTAQFFVRQVATALGVDTVTNGLMIDVEGYTKETPTVGETWPADKYAAWLHAHLTELQSIAPHAAVFGYTNASYWDQGVKDQTLAARLTWIGARYPQYSASGFQHNPLPSAERWPGWAFALAEGPHLPAGAPPWWGWQFAAGYNAAGKTYGCQSGDIDCNIIRPVAWRTWTNKPAPVVLPTENHPAPPVIERGDVFILTNSEKRGDFEPNVWKYVLIFDGTKWTKWHLDELVYVPGHPEGMRTNIQLDAIPDFAGMAPTASARSGTWSAT